MAALLQSEGISAGTFEALLSANSSHSGFSGELSIFVLFSGITHDLSVKNCIFNSFLEMVSNKICHL